MADFYHEQLPRRTSTRQSLSRHKLLVEEPAADRGRPRCRGACHRDQGAWSLYLTGWQLSASMY